MPLQNRVTPDMQIVRDNWRGDYMGNRGGRIHDPESKTLLKRKWASKRWIICVTKFKERQRKIMGNSYTELFFLDEVSALAAGHRPCSMDTQLHQERTGEHILLDEEALEQLPDGAMIKINNTCFAKKNASFFKWSGEGYSKTKLLKGEAFLLTPRSVLEVLSKGYVPHWHGSSC